MSISASGFRGSIVPAGGFLGLWYANQWFKLFFLMQWHILQTWTDLMVVIKIFFPVSWINISKPSLSLENWIPWYKIPWSIVITFIIQKMFRAPRNVNQILSTCIPKKWKYSTWNLIQWLILVCTLLKTTVWWQSILQWLPFSYALHNINFHIYIKHGKFISIFL